MFFTKRYNFIKLRFKILITLLISFNQYGLAQNQTLVDLEKKLITNYENDYEKVNLLNSIGQEYLITNPEKSMVSSRKALNLSKNIIYDKGFTMANTNLGIVYRIQGDYKEALRHLLISQKKQIKTNDYKNLANTVLNIGLIYYDLKEYDKAMKMYDEAVNLFISLELTEGIASAYTKMAIVLIEQKGKTSKALEYLTNALDINRKNKSDHGISEAYHCLAILDIKENNLTKAKYYIESSIQLCQQIQDIYGLTKGKILLGKVLRLRGNFAESENNLLIGLQNAKENYFKKQELFAYEELKKLKAVMNESKQALVFNDKYLKLKDILFNYKKTKEIALLEIKNSLEQVAEEKSILKRNFFNTVKNNKTLFIGILSLIITSIYLIKRNLYNKFFVKKELGIRKEEIFKNQNSFTAELIRKEKERQQKLEQKLEFKNKQLTSYAFNFHQKNKIINQLYTIAKDLEKTSSSSDQKNLVQELIIIGKENLQIDKKWESFRYFFEETQSGFHAKLKLKHSELRSNDLKICSLIRLNLNIKETADILNISPGSLKTARYRLRKKLNLEPKQEIIDYLISIENEEIRS